MRAAGHIGRLILGTAVVVCGGMHTRAARAHFVLVAPESSQSQGPFGDPQKLGPCGEEGLATPTGAVTACHPGQTIEVTIDEKIFHPGHYRVALAVSDRTALPPDPAVTAVDGDPCGSVAIADPPAFPILADDMLPHTEPFDTPQTFTVTLPQDITCTRCTLQVIEYMAEHSRPCFYHHCADLSIQGDATATATVAPTDTPLTTPTVPVTCAGDCDGNHTVTINELIGLVRVALRQEPITTCEAGDADGDRQIAISEILTAVNRALNGCAAAEGG